MMKEEGYFRVLMENLVKKRLSKIKKDFAKDIVASSNLNVPVSGPGMKFEVGAEKEKPEDLRRDFFISKLRPIFRDCILAFQMGLKMKSDVATEKYVLSKNFNQLCSPILNCEVCEKKNQ